MGAWLVPALGRAAATSGSMQDSISTDQVQSSHDAKCCACIKPRLWKSKCGRSKQSEDLSQTSNTECWSCRWLLAVLSDPMKFRRDSRS